MESFLFLLLNRIRARSRKPLVPGVYGSFLVLQRDLTERKPSLLGKDDEVVCIDDWSDWLRFSEQITQRENLVCSGVFVECKLLVSLRERGDGVAFALLDFASSDLVSSSALEISVRQYCMHGIHLRKLYTFFSGRRAAFLCSIAKTSQSKTKGCNDC